MKKIVIILGSVSCLFLMGCQKINNSETNQEIPHKAITSFEECVKANFPIQESYPRQCNDGTTTFIEKIETGESETGYLTTENLITGDLTTGEREITSGEIQKPITNELEQKLKSVIERRKQEAPTSSTGEENTKINEEDIEALENLIEEIIQK